jgi:glycosyltransferase involved in cell wall biosynthesis
MHAQLSKSIITCLLAGFICGTPVVIHERGAIFRKGISFSFYRFFLRLLHRRAAAIIANSQAIASELASKASIKPERINVIYNPVDFGVFASQKISRKQARENLGVSDEDFVVGFVGRLHPVKGVDILIKAFLLILQQSPHYLLVLAGDGPQRKSLEQMTTKLGVSDRVRFLGMRDDVPQIMAAFDIGVVPSRQEPFGRVAVEFMRMKVPVICSGADGLAELVHDGQTGIVVPKNSPEHICKAIQKLTKDEKLRRQLTEAAYAFSEHFGITEHIERLQEMYRKVLHY